MARIAPIGKRTAATVIALSFGVYVNQGHFNAVPSWALLVVCIVAGLYWGNLHSLGEVLVGTSEGR